VNIPQGKMDSMCRTAHTIEIIKLFWLARAGSGSCEHVNKLFKSVHTANLLTVGRLYQRPCSHRPRTRKSRPGIARNGPCNGYLCYELEYLGERLNGRRASLLVRRVYIGKRGLKAPVSQLLADIERVRVPFNHHHRARVL
jgi:hypothetical protein